MEGDTIRSSGSGPLVDLWVEGKTRAICVSREAIEAYLGGSGDGPPSDEECCEFVRTHLALVMTAAKKRLRETGPAASSITIEPGQLGARGGDRRKGERRKADRPEAIPAGGDRRRRAPRRKGERRSPARTAR